MAYWESSKNQETIAGYLSTVTDPALSPKLETALENTN